MPSTFPPNEYAPRRVCTQCVDRLGRPPRAARPSWFVANTTNGKGAYSCSTHLALSIASVELFTRVVVAVQRL